MSMGKKGWAAAMQERQKRTTGERHGEACRVSFDMLFHVLSLFLAV